MSNPRASRGVFSAIRKIFSSETKSGSGLGTLADPSRQLLELFSGIIEPTLADFTVTAINAMQCAPVRAAVQSISETVAQLPFEVFETDPATNAKTARNDHPAVKLIGGNPNPWTTASLFIEQVTRDALLQRWGGFAEIVRADDKPAELHRLEAAKAIQCPLQRRRCAFLVCYRGRRRSR